jgi:hypothetical protein
MYKSHLYCFISCCVMPHTCFLVICKYNPLISRSTFLMLLILWSDYRCCSLLAKYNISKYVSIILSWFLYEMTKWSELCACMIEGVKAVKVIVSFYFIFLFLLHTHNISCSLFDLFLLNLLLIHFVPVVRIDYLMHCIWIINFKALWLHKT